MKISCNSEVEFWGGFFVCFLVVVRHQGVLLDMRRLLNNKQQERNVLLLPSVCTAGVGRGVSSYDISLSSISEMVHFLPLLITSR